MKPSILIPSPVFKDYDSESLRAMLAHEYAHIARNDHWVLLYAACVRALLFFHPLVWFAVNRLAFSLEETADNAVLGKTDITADDYAEILLGVAATKFIPLSTMPFSRNHNILDRISAILKTSKTKKKGGGNMKRFKKYVLLLSAMVVLVFCLFVNFTCSNRQAVKSDSPDGIYMTVFGKVVDPDGKPVAGIPVDVAREKPRSNNFGNSLTGDTRFTVKTDPAGNFSISFPTNVDRGRASSFPELVNEGKNKNGGIVLVAHAGIRLPISLNMNGFPVWQTE